MLTKLEQCFNAMSPAELIMTPSPFWGRQLSKVMKR